jgi:hypothetical protein
VVEAPDLVGVRELDHVLRALDVGALRALLVGLNVIDGRQVEEVIDRLVEVVDAEARLREVTGHGDDPPLGGAEALHQRVELPARPLAYEHVDGALALQQLGDEMPADEAGRAGDEVVQESSRGLGRPLARARAGSVI